MSTTSLMKVSRNGQMSIPAAARSRWGADRVVVVDLGDHLVVRPWRADSVAALTGKYAGRGPNSEAMRRAERAADRDNGLTRRAASSR